MNSNFKNVTEYIKAQPKDRHDILNKIREIININAPDAIENIAYGMPAYKMNGKPLVYFACFKNHIGFYATPSGHDAFKKELSAYKQGRGSVQFPLDQTIPYQLIKKMVIFRVKENKAKSIK